MKIAIAVSILFMLSFWGCSMDDKNDGTTKIDIDFVWDLNHLARSPEIHLENVPEGINHLTIYFYDVTANNYSHGGGSIPYDGSGVIPVNAF